MIPASKREKGSPRPKPIRWPKSQIVSNLDEILKGLMTLRLETSSIPVSELNSHLDSILLLAIVEKQSRR